MDGVQGEKIILGRKIAEEGTTGNSRSVCYFFDRGFIETILCEEINGGIVDRILYKLTLAGLQASCHLPPR